MSLSSSPGLLFLVLLSLVTMVTLGVRAMDDIDYQKAKYHVRELEKILQPKTIHSIKRRSVTERSKDLESALDSVCSIWYSEKDKMTHDSKYPMPDIFPVTVKAERDGDKVKVTFQVKHTSNASVIQNNYLDHASMVIDAPESNGHPTTSQVQFLPNASWCGQDSAIPFGTDVVYGFYQENSKYYINVLVSVCGFDSYIDSRSGEIEKKRGHVFSQVLPTPQFKVLSDPGDEDIIINKGDNTTLDVEITMEKYADFKIFALMWDWESNTLLNDSVSVKVSSETDRLVTYNDVTYKGKLFEVNILSETVLGKTDNDGKNDEEDSDDDVKEDYPSINGVIRITFVPGSREISGNLVLLTSSRRYENQIVKRVNTERIMSLRLSDKTSVLPRNTIQFTRHIQNLYCTDHGGLKYGEYCTIQCYLQGTDIKSVSIVKSHPYRPTVKSSSIIFESFANARLDVGPVTPDNEGTYMCVAITENGTRKSKDINLYTKGFFTKITNLTLDDMGNSTTRVKCSIYGAQPLNVSITVNDGTLYDVFNYNETADYINKDEERLDNKTENVLFLESSDFETDLILYVQTDELRYPRKFLKCNSEGKRESDFRYINLSDNIKNYNPNHPKVKKEGFRLKKKKRNGKTVITCSATGKNISDIMVAAASYDMNLMFDADSYRIDNKPTNSRRVFKRGDTTIIKLTVPTWSLHTIKWDWDQKRIYCGAESKYGIDWLGFDIDKYGF